MAELRSYLEEAGFDNVSTYIASGNVILRSDKDAPKVRAAIEAMLPRRFKLDSALIKVLVLAKEQLQVIIDAKPKGFGEKPEKYYSDAIFLIGISIDEAMLAFDPREGVDMVWPGNGVVYSQRLGELRTKSRLSKIVAHPTYKSMTIRSWATTTALLELMS